MKITEKQLLLLLDVLKDSIKNIIEYEGQFSISRQQRTDIYAAIINQQSNVLKEIKDE